MVLLHEEVHRTAQRLTSATSRGIGRRFPRVLEEIDYAADLWTIVHELGRAMRTQEITHANALPHLRTLVDLHLAMLQAFDAESIPFQDVQVRRVTRYLIWYWQSVALEEVTSINEALHHLTTKPVLELAGVTRFLRGGRVWMDLEAHPNLTELGLLHGARFQVFPHSETVPVADILRGIRLSDDALVRGAIRSVQDMLR
jgi:hypothetical protein